LKARARAHRVRSLIGIPDRMSRLNIITPALPESGHSPIN
jgi:hypothetical protein